VEVRKWTGVLTNREKEGNEWRIKRETMKQDNEKKEGQTRRIETLKGLLSPGKKKRGL